MWKAAANDILSMQELKMICGAEGPCISILQPVSLIAAKPLHLRKAIRSVEQFLKERNIDASRQRDLLEPLYDFEEHEAVVRPEGKGFVVFRSPKVFRHFYISEPVQEFVTVADHFYILPLLPILLGEKIFYILTLSQKHIRLLRCGDGAPVEISLPPSIPRSLEDSMQTSRPDHMLDNRSWGGPSIGSMRGVMFGTGTDREAKDEYLLHFYKEVDRGIKDLLKTEEPLIVLAGVEYEMALYRRVSSYPRLALGGVFGALPSFKPGELYARASAVANQAFAAPLEDALQAYDKLGPERRSADWREVVKAAFNGRIAHLFLIEGEKHMGTFNPSAQTVVEHAQALPEDEDLINAAAVETLLHGGLVDIVPPEKAPDGAPVSALLRY
jgi:hypothetical protein